MKAAAKYEQSNKSKDLQLVSLKINNDTESRLEPKECWFGSGSFLKENEFVAINARDHDKLHFIKNNGLAGVSGYIHYKHSMMGDVVIAFSNPVIGTCKLNVGVLSKSEKPESVWDKMSYISLKEEVQVNDDFRYDMVNTTGDINEAVVNFYDY